MRDLNYQLKQRATAIATAAIPRSPTARGHSRTRQTSCSISNIAI